MLEKHASKQQYSATYYNFIVETAATSAKTLLGSLYNLYTPQRVIDFGCGQGTWLHAAEQLGSQTIVGLDGAWVDSSSLHSPNIEFRSVDFANHIPQETGYDLAISVEVAEHLPLSQADAFVAALCNAADIVVFGAAIPFQGGLHHINEEWQRIWIDRFAQHGFVPYDIFRAAFWNDPTVSYWYKQNTFLFVKPSQTAVDSAELTRLQNQHRLVNVVHPDLYTMRSSIDETPTLKHALRINKRWLMHMLKR